MSNLTTTPAVAQQMTTFSFQTATGDGLKVRVVMRGEEPWFVASDIVTCLGRSGGGHIAAPLAHDEKGLIPVQTPGGLQRVVVVSEAGLYRVLMRSNSPHARAFQDWVVRDVLPAIRKTGSYVRGEEKIATAATLSDLEALQEDILALMGRKAALLEAKLQERTAALAASREALSASTAALAGTVVALEQSQETIAALEPPARTAALMFNRRTHVKLAQAVRTLDGVNTNALKRDLEAAGYLYKTGTGYRVRAEHRDRLFVPACQLQVTELPKRKHVTGG